MADGENGEKSEPPSGRKIAKARSEGQVGRSVEFSQVVSLTAAFLALQYFGPRLWHDMVVILQGGLTSRYTREPFHLDDLRYQFFGILWLILPDLLAMVTLAAFFGAGSTLLQTKFLWTTKLLWPPRLSRLNPISGIKKFFTITGLVGQIKAYAKFAIIAPIGYFAFVDMMPEFIGIMKLPITQILPFTNLALGLVFWKVMKFMAILGVLDLLWSKYSNYRNLKMTKTEVKEERKSVEGDEETKNAIKAKAFNRMRMRILSNVRKADVVVTNPTHLAVALAYSLEPGSAPKVVAKGRGHLAEQIKKIAREHKIPVVERKLLARTLYGSVEVEQYIPYELYAAVAELLAYVYKLKGKNPLQSKMREGKVRATTKEQEGVREARVLR